MRKINYIVVHCSATREGCTLTSEVLEAEHRRRGFRTTGYHYYIRRDGTVLGTRSLELPGAHCRGHIIQLKYRNELSWIINKGETDEEKAFENCLNDSNSYYSCIYINELEKYLLLYCPSKRIMYYMRQNGF